MGVRFGFKTNRFYSSSGSSGSPGSGKPNHFRILLVLGTLAIGTTIYNTVSSPSTSKMPTAFVEPDLQAKKPAFSSDQVSVIFVLGGPGSGKGTQCANLVKDYGFVHLSAGDLLRAEQNNPNSKYGELIKTCIKEGTIVPQEITINLLQQAMEKEVTKGNLRFLIDGFPRKMDQALTFENQIVKSSLVLFFQCPESVMLTRLLKRGETSGRSDDNVESIKKRFKTFVETSMPVVEYYGKQNKVIQVNCEDAVDKVYANVKFALKDKLNIDTNK
ncbi:hypothetical protein PACTADRAFT_39710 [Pachysolen tannophilus NRRL Y-2460]|uniref:Uridylate kinase n=1 Tax=Pachysolen tannophilus NRRL Y-2460 TaxID=669874 RepID=A0A1E4TYR5_PACTA|nr:hypothetical protein PACTADRAFT_39710 [Pachysolen tannophilus NRRL Y-2460]